MYKLYGFLISILLSFFTLISYVNIFNIQNIIPTHVINNNNFILEVIFNGNLFILIFIEFIIIYILAQIIFKLIK